MAAFGKMLKQRSASLCESVETISTCSGDSDCDAWPDTDEECFYPSTGYAPPRSCEETASLASLMTSLVANSSPQSPKLCFPGPKQRWSLDIPRQRHAASPKSNPRGAQSNKKVVATETSGAAAMRSQLNEANEFGDFVLDRARKLPKRKTNGTKKRTQLAAGAAEVAGAAGARGL